MTNTDLIPNLFRSEYSKLIAVLAKSFGFEHIEIAEDIASETFLLAVDSWPYKGVPENPVAWLYAVAKNKAKNYVNRNKVFREKIVEKIKSTNEKTDGYDIDLSTKNIADSQLQMLFAICHPAIPKEAQIGLALRILCGFGIDEIADAFLVSSETIHKRLHRAKKKLRSENIQIEFPGEDQLNKRIETVLRTLYLLFSEGYYSASRNTVVRKDLCLEAMKLTYLMLDNDSTNTHSSNALMSLMCFHSSRLDARCAESGEMILYQDQDEKRWNSALVEKGFYYLQQASKWEIGSKYYLEASIAYWHTLKTEDSEKWENILKLYDLLLGMDPSPVIALNRVFALSKVHGTEAAIAEAEKIKIKNNHLYWILLADLHKEFDFVKAKKYLENALVLSKTDAEKSLISRKILDLSLVSGH